MKHHIATAALLASTALSLAACGTVTTEKTEASSGELGFVGSGEWTVFKLQAGPNPAEKIAGDVRGFVSPEIERTMLLVSVSGLPANKTFGAHLHAASCATNSGGGHYQHAGAVVNEENEVWLDFTTGPGGVAQVVARKPFAIATERAKSVVVHAQATDPATGKAGDKLACIDVLFVDVPPPGAPDAAEREAGEACSVSYSCINNVCTCGDAKDGEACASPAECENTCVSCE
jgi:hypothetical protein